MFVSTLNRQFGNDLDYNKIQSSTMANDNR